LSMSSIRSLMSVALIPTPLNFYAQDLMSMG
jgi:hypothetical protein